MNRILHSSFTALILCVNTSVTFAQVLNTTQVSLIPHSVSHDVPPALKGVNQTANTSLDWVYNDEFESEFSGVDIGTMRFPGGTFANSYDWIKELQDNSNLNLKNTIGLATEMEVDINYVLNYGTTTPEEAAELVRILNDPSPVYEALRQSYFGMNVSDPIGVKYWELGNELAAKWEWHVSWVAGGHNQQIFFKTGDTPLDMPRLTTDYLHYFGGEIWRAGWVNKWGDGMTILNSMLGDFHKVTAQEELDQQAYIEVEFGPISGNEVKIYVYNNVVDFSQYEDQCNANPTPCQQALYDTLADDMNLLDASEYTIQGDSGVLIHPSDPFLENHSVLVEYKTHHAGAFDIRDAMKAADPSIEIGYCIDFRQNLLDTPGFNDRLIQSPPDFLIEHPYNGTNTGAYLNNGGLSEIIHMVDDKISDDFIPQEEQLDSICENLNIPDIGLALTEWNIRLCGDGGCDLAYNGILGGLYTANFFSQFYQIQADTLLDIRLSNHFAGIASGFNLIHMWHYDLEFEADPLVISTPQSHATRMVNEVVGETMLHSSEIVIENNPTHILTDISEDASGNTVLTEYSSEALKIMISDDVENNVLKILVLNNDDSQNHTIDFIVPCDRVGTDASLEILDGELDDYVFYIDNSTISPASNTYTFTVPKFSVSTLKIPYSSSPTSCVCYADFDQDGFVGVLDLLDLLSEFGCTEDCITDLNADGQIVVSDILIFLALFEEQCS